MNCASDIVIFIRSRIICISDIILNNGILAIRTRSRIFQWIIKTFGAYSDNIYIAITKNMFLFFFYSRNGSNFCMNTEISHIVIISGCYNFIFINNYCTMFMWIHWGFFSNFRSNLKIISLFIT